MSDPTSPALEALCWCGAACDQLECAFTHARRPWRMLRCVSCGTARLWPRPDDAALDDAYASDYYGSGRRKFRGPVGGLFALTQDTRARWAATFRPTGGRLLDVGCG